VVMADACVIWGIAICVNHRHSICKAALQDGKAFACAIWKNCRIEHVVRHAELIK